MSERPLLPGYEVLEQIGRGAGGSVWAVRRPDGARLAVKFVTDRDADELLQHEAALLQTLRHEHVIRLHDVVRAPDGSLATVMQLAEGGSLAESLRTRDHLTPGELITVLCPIARALHDLHSMGLVHGDLSPGNILFTLEGKPLIADLGVARLGGEQDLPLWATENWAAPEVLAGEQPTPAADVYSLGALAWTALVGAPPEPAALRPDLADVAPHVADRMRDLIQSCLTHTPGARPTPEEFALELWGMGDPQPAPVQGSPGRRGAEETDDDPGLLLTRRIRDDAQRESVGGRHSAPEPPARSWWRTPVATRTAGAAAFVGLVTGGLVLVGNGSSARQADPAATVSQPSSAPATTSRPTTPSPTSTQVTPPVLTPAAQLRRAPTQVLQRLLDARAHAWTTGRSTDLAGGMAAGSAAYRADAGALGTAQGSSIRYAGLHFQVRSAQLTTVGATSAQLRAVVDRSAYVVTRGGARSPVQAGPGARTRITVTWTAGAWRIASWAPA